MTLSDMAIVKYSKSSELFSDDHIFVTFMNFQEIQKF